MIIAFDNIKTIDDSCICIHDDVLDSIEFNRIDKELRLHCIKHWPSEDKYIVKFNNVIGYTITSCDLWGKSESVLDFEFLNANEQVIIPMLFDKCSNLPNNRCDPLKIKKCIEVRITFKSGDTLIIACEEIVFPEVCCRF